MKSFFPTCLWVTFILSAPVAVALPDHNGNDSPTNGIPDDAQLLSILDGSINGLTTDAPVESTDDIVDSTELPYIPVGGALPSRNEDVSNLPNVTELRLLSKLVFESAKKTKNVPDEQIHNQVECSVKNTGGGLDPCVHVPKAITAKQIPKPGYEGYLAGEAVRWSFKMDSESKKVFKLNKAELRCIPGGDPTTSLGIFVIKGSCYVKIEVEMMGTQNLPSLRFAKANVNIVRPPQMASISNKTLAIGFGVVIGVIVLLIYCSKSDNRDTLSHSPVIAQPGPPYDTHYGAQRHVSQRSVTYGDSNMAYPPHPVQPQPQAPPQNYPRHSHNPPFNPNCPSHNHGQNSTPYPTPSHHSNGGNHHHGTNYTPQHPPQQGITQGYPGTNVHGQQPPKPKRNVGDLVTGAIGGAAVTGIAGYMLGQRGRSESSPRVTFAEPEPSYGWNTDAMGSDSSSPGLEGGFEFASD